MFNKYRNYLVSPFLTILIVLIIYFIKGIYPFGSMTIANGDLGQSSMHIYYFLYDVCVGSKSLFFDYCLGMGSNMYGVFVLSGFFNPLSYVILLNSRDNIPYIMSFVLLIKFSFIAFTSFLLFKRINKKNNYYNYLFSILYALSGYSLMYNTNIVWLDIVGLFPLLLLSINYMIYKNRIIYFSIVLFLIILFNYNLAFMVLLFLVIIVPIYIFYSVDECKRKACLFNLIIGIIISLGLSSFAIIPSFFQVLDSFRMNQTTESNGIVLKIAMFLFYSLPLVIILKSLKIKDNKISKYIVFIISLLLCAVVPILFERVNLLWHGGGYNGFPFRYGFISILIIYMWALHVINCVDHVGCLNKFKLSKKLILFVLFIICSVLGVYVSISINKGNPAFVLNIKSFLIICILFFVSFIIYYLLFGFKNYRSKYVLISVVSLFFVFVYSYAYIGVYPRYREKKEWSDDGVFNAIKIDKKVNEEIYRLKDLSMMTNENYPLISNTPSMSTFLHLITYEQMLNAYQLGYSYRATQMNDFGGTLFSDAIYGVKYVISSLKLSDRLYEYKGMIDDKYLYQYKNVLPYGILYDNDNIRIPGMYREFEANNYLYKTLFNKEDNIIDVKFLNQVNKVGELEYTIDVQGEKELYLYTEFLAFKYILINGEKKIIPIENDSNNTKYPTYYDNGILDLGYYNNETVKVSFELLGNNGKSSKVSFNSCSNNEINEDDVSFGLLDIGKYEELFNYNHDVVVSIEKNNINIKGNVDKDTSIFLPIIYNDGFSGNTTIKKVYNTFMGVSLKKGYNDIKITFKPKCYEEGVYITLLTVLIILFCYYFKIKSVLINNKIVMNIVYFFSKIIWLIVFARIYIIGIIESIFHLY